MAGPGFPEIRLEAELQQLGFTVATRRGFGKEIEKGHSQEFFEAMINKIVACLPCVPPCFCPNLRNLGQE
jgi:hypothetical protein